MATVSNEYAGPGRTIEHKALESDVVIFVLGGIGAGKSTFINYILDDIVQDFGTRMVVHDNLDPCTLEITPIRLQPTRGEPQDILDLRRVVLVDGPGLEDIDLGQHVQVRGDAKGWVSTYHRSNDPAPHRGVIYIQNIAESDLNAPLVTRNLYTLIQFCKDIRCGDIMLVTMKWGMDPRSEAGYAKLRAGRWKKMIDAGIEVRKIEEGEEKRSAMDVIRFFLTRTQEERRLSLENLASRLAPILPVRPPLCHLGDSLPPRGGRPNDLVILVMGHLKSGKSSFINRVLESSGQAECMEVTDDIESATDLIQSAILHTKLFPFVGGRRVILVDTPGFQGTDVDDVPILEGVAKWLNARFGHREVFGGIIYLHDISQDGFNRMGRRMMNLVPLLIPNFQVKQLVITTSKWDRLPVEEGVVREAELKTSFWNDFSITTITVQRLTPAEATSVRDAFDPKGLLAFILHAACRQ